MTGDHRIAVYRDNKITYILAKDLKIGDKLIKPKAKPDLVWLSVSNNKVPSESTPLYSVYKDLANAIRLGSEDLLSYKSVNEMLAILQSYRDSQNKSKKQKVSPKADISKKQTGFS